MKLALRLGWRRRRGRRCGHRCGFEDAVVLREGADLSLVRAERFRRRPAKRRFAPDPVRHRV